jgi:dextranase
MTEDYDILHLINLSSETDNQWRNTTNVPTTKSNLPVKYYLSPNSGISGVYLASPDFNEGTTQTLSYTTGTDSTGFFVSFTVPSLQYWDMVYIKRTVTAPANNVYEAENAIKTNVSVNTNHTGYTGTGFVDCFAESGDEVTFQIKVPSDNNYTLTFKYANNTGYTATKHIYIDGSYAGTLNMSNLSNWDTWSTASLSKYLGEGIHTVCIYYASDDNHAINLDSLTVN